MTREMREIGKDHFREFVVTSVAEQIYRWKKNKKIVTNHLVMAILFDGLNPVWNEAIQLEISKDYDDFKKKVTSIGYSNIRKDVVKYLESL